MEKSQKNKKTKKLFPLWLIILLDAVAIGITLCTFAYFHHVRVVDYSDREFSKVDLGWEDSSDEPSDSVRFEESDSVSETIEASEQSTENAESLESEETEEQSEASAEKGDFTSVFENASVDEDAYKSYAGENVIVNLYKIENNVNGDMCYYFADVYVRHISNLKTAFAYDTYGQSINEETLKMATKNSAVVAINGDYYGIHRRGVVIRNGTVYRETATDDVCVIFSDGVMKTYLEGEFDIDEVCANGAYQAWNFGPALLNEDGSAIESFTGNRDISGINPRTAIGYFEPGHYCFVVVDGRQEGYSHGATLEQLSEILAEHGCVSGYNLDGGKTSMMIFGDEVANRPTQGGRDVSDIIFVAE